jgi:hypothetical protein
MFGISFPAQSFTNKILNQSKKPYATLVEDQLDGAETKKSFLLDFGYVESVGSVLR